MRNDGKPGMSDEEVDPLAFHKLTILELTSVFIILYKPLLLHQSLTTKGMIISTKHITILPER
jgi:hypothetical protein